MDLSQTTECTLLRCRQIACPPDACNLSFSSVTSHFHFNTVTLTELALGSILPTANGNCFGERSHIEFSLFIVPEGNLGTGVSNKKLLYKEKQQTKTNYNKREICSLVHLV